MFLIKSEDQYHKTLKRIEGAKEQIEHLQRERGSAAAEAFKASIQDHLHELEAQILKYDHLQKAKR